MYIGNSSNDHAVAISEHSLAGMKVTPNPLHNSCIHLFLPLYIQLITAQQSVYMATYQYSADMQ